MVVRALKAYLVQGLSAESERNKSTGAPKIVLIPSRLNLHKRKSHQLRLVFLDFGTLIFRLPEHVSDMKSTGIVAAQRYDRERGESIAAMG